MAGQSLKHARNRSLEICSTLCTSGSTAGVLTAQCNIRPEIISLSLLIFMRITERMQLCILHYYTNDQHVVNLALTTALFTCWIHFQRDFIPSLCYVKSIHSNSLARPHHLSHGFLSCLCCLFSGNSSDAGVGRACKIGTEKSIQF